MRTIALAVFVALSVVGSASAQFPFGPPPGAGLGFYHANRRMMIAGYITGPGFGYRCYSPYIYAPGYALPAGFSSTTIVVAQRRVSAPPVTPALLPNLPTVPPLDERDEVIVIRPRPGGVKNLPPARPGVRKDGPADKPFDPPPLLAPRVEKDAAAEAARQLQLGKEAFRGGEYGRALERFEQAARLAPNDGWPHVLKAQAEAALGKYAEATASIIAGMRRRPEWPREKFEVLELYGRNGAEGRLHLDLLRQAAEANPQEPAVLFLYGHQLWFHGRRAEAKDYFRRAMPLVADPQPIERFLQEPDGPIVAR